MVQEGVTVLQEIEDLQGGLKDTVKAVAEELDIKPALINKAIKIAQKRDWEKHADAFDDLETLVATVGDATPNHVDPLKLLIQTQPQTQRFNLITLPMS